MVLIGSVVPKNSDNTHTYTVLGFICRDSIILTSVNEDFTECPGPGEDGSQVAADVAVSDELLVADVVLDAVAVHENNGAAVEPARRRK